MTNLQVTLVQVAKNELLLKPAMAMDINKERLVDGNYKELWQCSKEDVLNLYDKIRLAPSRVISMLVEDPLVHTYKSRLQVFSGSGVLDVKSSGDSFVMSPAVPFRLWRRYK